MPCFEVKIVYWRSSEDNMTETENIPLSSYTDKSIKECCSSGGAWYLTVNCRTLDIVNHVHSDSTDKIPHGKQALSDLRSYFADLPPSEFETLEQLVLRSKEQAGGSFRMLCRTGRENTTVLQISGYPIYSNLTENHLLLLVEDISHYVSDKNKIYGFEKDHGVIQKQYEKKNKEATASLIDTNVVLRKEIRDRQKAILALQESEARFRDLAETTSDFIWEINLDGKYTYASPKITDLLGIQPADLIDTLFFLMRESGSVSSFFKEVKLNKYSSRGFSKIVHTCKHVKGHLVTIESSGEPIFTSKDELIGYRGIDRDITVRRVYEDTLKKAKDQAEAANIAKSEFLANMSHELRTPLHAILSFAKYGVKKIGTADKSSLEKYFNQIILSGQRLMPLIDSLLNLAKLESGKTTYDIQELDLRDELVNAIDELTQLAEKKNISIEIEPFMFPTIAFFDNSKIAQVIRNILSNAIKFGFEKTTISVSFNKRISPNLKSYLQTSICNHGIEIPEGELTDIFDKFAQSSKTKTGAGGTGLGLSICKEIIRDHRGEIWASRGSGEITEFHFTLPMSAKIEKIGQILINKGLLSKEELYHALKDQ